MNHGLGLNRFGRHDDYFFGRHDVKSLLDRLTAHVRGGASLLECRLGSP